MRSFCTIFSAISYQQILASLSILPACTLRSKMKLSTSIVVLIPALGALPCLAHPQPLSPEAFPPDYSTSTALPGPDEPYANSEPTGTASLDITPMNDTDFIPPFQERQAGLVPPPPVTTYLDVYICDGENWTGNCTHFSAPLCVPVTPDPLDECWTMHSLFEHLVTLPPN